MLINSSLSGRFKRLVYAHRCAVGEKLHPLKSRTAPPWTEVAPPLRVSIKITALCQNFDRKQSLFSTFGHFLCCFRYFTATFWEIIFSRPHHQCGLKIPLSLFAAVQNLNAKRATATDFSVAVLDSPYAFRTDLSRSFSAAISAFFCLIISASFSSHSSLVSA